MQEWVYVGKQRVRRLPNGLFIEMHGQYTLAEARVLYPMLAELWRDNLDTLVLVDCHQISGSMSAEVRRYAVEFAREHRIEGDTIIIGAGLLVVTLIKMVLQAMALVAKQKPRLYFVKTEAEAWDLSAQLRSRIGGARE